MKRLNCFLVLLSSVLFSINAFAAKQNPDEKLVKEAYYEWCDSISKAHGDPKIVTQYYAPKALLLPTLSQEILTNENNGLDAYFQKLTSHPNIKCTPNKLITRMYKATAINTGLYKFSYTDHGKTVNIPARFTFIYEKNNGKWLIIKHHSSKMPK